MTQEMFLLKKIQLWINFYILSGFNLILKEETAWGCKKQLLITLIAAPARSFEARGESAHGVVGSTHTKGERLSSPPVSFILLVSCARNQTRIPRGQSVIQTRH